MAPQNEAEEETLDPFIISSLGLGLGFLIITQSQTLKPLSTAIKLADGAIKIPKALKIIHSPYSPKTLIFASKVLIKGFKASNRLIPIKSHPKSSTRLKAYIGAINLIRYNEFLGLGFLRGGYKISKSFVNVIEGFVGFQLDSALKQGIDALGLLAKAWAVAREVTRFRQRRNGLGFDRRVYRGISIFSEHNRFDFGGVCSLKESSFRERGAVMAKDFECLKGGAPWAPQVLKRGKNQGFCLRCPGECLRHPR